MEKSCSFLVHFDGGTPAIANDIKKALEGNDDAAKIDALKNAISLLQNGETLPQLFITIVQYVLPSEAHTVQKLLLHYLEIIDKTDSKGKVLPELILICQYLRNNLQRPDEYIRGVTLRFLCRICEAEIIEPLIPSILANLEHQDPFVRSNAILAMSAIYKLPQGDQLLVDAPEMIEKVLTTEADQSAKRNAFLMLCTCAQDNAVNYLLTNVEKVSEWGESLQMAVLDLIRKVCRAKKGEKGKYIKIIISLLDAPSAAVIFECAGTLVSLSSAPTAIRAAANTYCKLLLNQSDNNVKLIGLDCLEELKTSHREIMVDMIMDVLRALSNPNHDIRRKTLAIVLDLITPWNINEVVLTLKKEVVKTQSGELEKDGEYRQMLIQAILSCAVKFPEVAGTVVHMLMDILGDSNVASAMDVIVFVREIIESNPKLSLSIVTRLLDLIRKACSGAKKGKKRKYIEIIISLLDAPSTAVIYECAGTPVSLSSDPLDIRVAANAYCKLLLHQSDNNVKLIVLGRLEELKTSHREIMVDMIMDVLRALSSPNHDIRRKTLAIVLDLITPRNINEVFLTLEKEMAKFQSLQLEKDGEYLIQAIHSLEVKRAFNALFSSQVYIRKEEKRRERREKKGRKSLSFLFLPKTERK